MDDKQTVENNVQSANIHSGILNSLGPFLQADYVWSREDLVWRI